MSLQRREGACGDVQDHHGAGPGHHNLDDMAKIRPPDLMLEGFEWRARPLDKVFDADTRAVLKRCILVEVTAQCVKDSVREKRKFGSDKAISMAESLRALYNGQ